MPKLRVLSGADVLRILKSFGFFIASQKGSHIKCVRESENGREVLVIPNHKSLDKGTTKAIFRQASAYISKVDLRTHFYED